MKKAEAISILATSVRPREAKDRARYDEAVKMAIEALKCSETPKSSERTSETAQADHTADIGKKAEQAAETAQNVSGEDSISRKAAIDALAKFVPYAICDESTESYANGLTDAYNLILQLPSAQPERKRGKWIPFDIPWYRCSECGAERENEIFMENFCPNCGADMRGGDSE